MVFSSQALIVGCAVSDIWAGEQCKRAVEKAGGRHVTVSAETLDRPISLGDFSACIYDLAPWDARVPERLQRLRKARPEMPLLFYLPPRPNAVAILSDCNHFANVRFRIQVAVRNELRLFERDAKWLLQAVPVQRMLDALAETVDDAPPIVHLFCRVVLRRLSVGLRCTVCEVGQDLGISSRTAQRHLADNPLGSPKQMIDRLTVSYACYLADFSGTSMAYVARCLGMMPNDLYRLRSRVFSSLMKSTSRRMWEEMMSRLREWEPPQIQSTVDLNPRPIASESRDPPRELPRRNLSM